MHDGSTLKDDLQIYRAEGKEVIIPLFEELEMTVKRGDLVYTQWMRPYAWLGERDVDSDEYKVSDETTCLLLVALGNSATSAAYNRDACQKVLELIKKTCPEATAEFLPIHCFAE